MSTAQAIAAVSAVLRARLHEVLTEAGLGFDVHVTALAPDLIKLDDPQATAQLNLFLYRLSLNPGWRNAGPSARDSAGARLTNPALAVDLHYLLTAYAREELHAEILLGHATQASHEQPWLNRTAINATLHKLPDINPKALREPPHTGLADQLESVKITWQPLDTDELSKLWSALHVPYRPSVAYQVTTVLIESQQPTRPTLPVLTRVIAVQPSLMQPTPTIAALAVPEARQAAEPGDTITLHGHHLGGDDVAVHFAHRLLDQPHILRDGVSAGPDRLEVTLPSDESDQAWPAGVWTVHATVVRPGETVPRPTNSVAMLLAPVPSLPPQTLERDEASNKVTVELRVTPAVELRQTATLALGTVEVTATPPEGPEGPEQRSEVLHFTFDDLPPGPAWLRLRVDGVQSRLINASVTPPEFFDSQRVEVP